jgi:peroxiredoxin
MKLHQLIMLAAFAAPLSLYAQQSYTIKGTIGKLNPPAKAILTYKKNGERVFDSTEIKNGQFIFRGEAGGTKEAHLVVKHGNESLNPVMRPKEDILPFFIEDKSITVSAKDSISKAVIKGSQANDDNIAVTELLRPYYNRYDALNKEFKDAPEEKQKEEAFLASLDQRAAAIMKEIISVKMKYVKANPSRFMALMAFNSTLPPEFDAIQAEKDYLSLDEKLRNTDLGKELGERIAKVKKTQEGAPAPDFTMNDVDGKPVKLSDFRGKWVLLDFWASWCKPCRRENPNLVKAYNDFKDKGFTILGVSLDKPEDKEKWLEAIRTDGLAWTQLSDLKAWENEAAKLYDVNAIPMNFLINPEGKIVAKYLRGEGLHEQLRKLMK